MSYVLMEGWGSFLCGRMTSPLLHTAKLREGSVQETQRMMCRGYPCSSYSADIAPGTLTLNKHSLHLSVLSASLLNSTIIYFTSFAQLLLEY